MTTDSSTDLVQKAYIAYYSRPADPGGLNYWANLLELSGGDLSTIIEAFGVSEEFNERFGSASSSDLVDNIYQSLFNRAPDEAGKAFYVGLLDSGEISLQEIALNVLFGATNDDATVIENKLLSATYFTEQLQATEQAYTDLETAVEILANVGVTSDTVVNTFEAIETLIRPDLSTTEQEVDDFAANNLTVGRINPGDVVVGEISDSDDVDFVAIDLLPGVAYLFQFEGTATGGGTLTDPYISGLYDDELFELGYSNDDGGEGNNAQVTFTPSVAGTYYIGLSGYNAVGSYTLKVSGEDDYVSNLKTSASVSVDSSFVGEINYSLDQDWIAVELDQSGLTYIIEAKGEDSGLGTLPDPEIQVYNSNLDRVAYDYDGGVGDDALATITLTSEELGTYYIAVEDDYYGSGYYVVSVDGSDDYLSNMLTTGFVVPGGSTTGVINAKYDSDLFRLDLDTAGKAYTINLSGEHNGMGTLSDPELRFYDSQGSQLANDYDSGPGNNALITIIPDVAGTYYVLAYGDYTASGTYTLSVDNDDSILSNTETSASIGINATFFGEIENQGDIDWVAVELLAGRSYQIDVLGAATVDGTLEDPYLNGIYNHVGDFYRSSNDDDDGVGNNAQEIFSADYSGTYFIGITGESRTSGTYLLSVEEVA
ncbi:serralysin [Oleiphilus messinensis]|uniref:Serralysin n=1 Tax=Oleiphilus messinensis TaxID=141451 RepID=A0A1Y0IG92_9GAMM|nr:pre-peptidase C-terminal domain-containing protein [Oleiphilus messinensis]ARU59149.1 serralysin [Oleiphilus messinensis]